MVALSVGYCSKSNPVTAAPPGPTALEGIWSGSLTNPNGVIDTTTWIFTFKTDSITVKQNVNQDTTVHYSGTFTLDTTVVPNQITIHITYSATPQQVGQTIQAIYSQSVNVLQISANAPGSARPSAFDGTIPVYGLILQ